MKLIDAFISKNAAKILWLAAGILIAFIFLQQCKGRKQSEAFKLLEAKAKTLEQKVATSEVQRLEGRKQFDDYKKDAEGRQQLIAVEKAEADKKVTQQQKTIDRLASVIRSTTNQPVDSSFVLVSPDFKKACDSFPNEVAALNLALADRDTSINEMIDLYSYEIQIRDEELFKEMNYSDSLKVDFVRQTQLLKSALKQGKPRGQFLTGVGIMGNQDQFLGGASFKAAYLTKGGKMYQYSPHVLKLLGMPSAKLYHELSVLFNPFK